MYGILVAVFQRRFGGGIPGGSTLLEKGHRAVGTELRSLEEGAEGARDE